MPGGSEDPIRTELCPSILIHLRRRRGKGRLWRKTALLNHFSGLPLSLFIWPWFKSVRFLLISIYNFPLISFIFLIFLITYLHCAKTANRETEAGLWCAKKMANGSRWASSVSASVAAGPTCPASTPDCRPSMAGYTKPSAASRPLRVRIEAKKEKKTKDKCKKKNDIAKEREKEEESSSTVSFRLSTKRKGKRKRRYKATDCVT